MFPKNSAFSKSDEQVEYEQGVRERALHSVNGTNELERFLKEAKEVLDEIRTASIANEDSNVPDKKGHRTKASKPRRPY